MGHGERVCLCVHASYHAAEGLGSASKDSMPGRETIDDSVWSDSGAAVSADRSLRRAFVLVGPSNGEAEGREAAVALAPPRIPVTATAGPGAIKGGADVHFSTRSNHCLLYVTVSPYVCTSRATSAQKVHSAHHC
jgi:hypothetical protein